MRNEKDEMIRATASPALLEEVEEIFDMAIREEWESVTTFGDAFDHVSDLSDQDEWRHLRTPCRRVHQLGDRMGFQAWRRGVSVGVKINHK